MILNELENKKTSEIKQQEQVNNSLTEYREKQNAKQNPSNQNYSGTNNDNRQENQGFCIIS